MPASPTLTNCIPIPRFLSTNNEFSIAFWIKFPSLEKKSKTRHPPRHIVSIGNKSGLLEVWIHGTSSMIVRSTVATEVNSVMSRATFTLGDTGTFMARQMRGP